MYRFMRLQGFENYHELYDWSINQRSLFWEAIVDFCDIQFSKKPEINLIEGVDMERYKKNIWRSLRQQTH